MNFTWNTSEVIATSKESTSIYKYNYNLTIMEERYNILRFQSGMADLLYSQKKFINNIYKYKYKYVE